MPSYFFSAPGRTEISGNHTDHQHGCVLAAAVNLVTAAEVVLHDQPMIIVCSEGYAPVTVELNDLSVHEEEKTPRHLLSVAWQRHLYSAVLLCRASGPESVLRSSPAAVSALPLHSKC